MRNRYKLLALVIACMMFCTSCAQSRQVENQAYIIVMAVDSDENGGITLTAKIPTLSSSSSGDAPSPKDSYKHFSASGTTYNTALESLHLASPRNLNLAHLQLLVISKDVAERADFRSLIEDIAQTERLYTASYTIICAGSASEYISALEPAIGSRLSLDIPAIFENLSEQGVIPESTLADLYYLTETVYSDPLLASAELTAADSGAGANIKPITKTMMLGALVFSNGKPVLGLNADECILTNLIRNEVKYFRYEIDGRSIEAAPSSPARISVDLDKVPTVIHIKLKLSIGTQEDMPEVTRIKSKMESDILALIEKAQKNGVEPFGFANSAAKKFPTLKKWMDFEWKENYKNANVDISISVSRWDT